jgi:hypothetical protein
MAENHLDACRAQEQRCTKIVDTHIGFIAPGFRVCVKTRVWYWPGWTPASAGVTALGLGVVFRPVIPAKAGIHEFSHRLFSPAQPPNGDSALRGRRYATLSHYRMAVDLDPY